jgi:hypothetical protein
MKGELMTDPGTTPDPPIPTTEPTTSNAMPRITARSLTLAMIGLVAVITLMFISYTSGFGHPQPRNIPVAVAGPPQLQRTLNASPELAVTPAASPLQARRLVLDRHAYGALVVSGRHAATLYVANGAGHSVEAALKQVAAGLAQQAQIHVTATDLAPTSPNDPNGTVEFYCVVFLAVGGALGASIFARIHGPITSARQLLQRTLTLTVYTALAAAAYLLFVDTVFGALTGHPAWLFLALWGYTLAVTLAASGISALLGTAAGITLTLLFTLLGNPSAGGAVGRPLLNPFFAALTPIFPHGGGLSIIRGIQYFHGRGITAGILCLTIWGAGGAALLAIAARRGHATRLAASPT